ncbi:acidic mammalian chitinase-like [Brachionus plicatilis]|uniref:Acidic mammalian chitinase-like n=1 Tax=Brachionus plicatilis TaxID=10195 RepID=A0A3M7T7C8_BRAPC|nr:acidic mammalian chitinase-like [Brachionus plicatilis]
MKLILLGIIFSGINVIYCEQRVVCYFTNWSQYRTGVGKYLPEDIDPFLCTHIMYSFAKIVNNKLEPYEWNDDSNEWSKGLYERTNDLKKINPNLKVMLAVGGWNMGTAPFISVVSSDANIQSFVDTSVIYLKKRNFDGLDLDWEYPEGYKSQFTRLVKALKSRFVSENLLLSAAVAAGKSKIDSSYDLPELSKNLDFLNVMSYDYHGSWDKNTGHNAPLYSPSTLNVDFTISYYIQLGFSAEKINLGLATYGRSFTLSDPNQNSVGSQISGPGIAQTFTREDGYSAYYEICSKSWTKAYDSQSKVPYMYSGNQWISYDDSDSLKQKVEYAKFKNLGGIMFWAIDLDDFSGSVCGQGRYPLINSAKENFLSSSNILSTSSTEIRVKSSSSSSSSTSKIPSSTSKSTTSTRTTSRVDNDIGKTQPAENLCFNRDGYYPDIKSGCQKFYVCVYYGTQHQQIHYFDCPKGTLFDTVNGICNHEYLVKCD